MNGLKSRNS